jgi:hypothetical protein
MTIDMQPFYGNSSSGGTNTMTIGILGDAGDYYLLNVGKTYAFQQATTTQSDIKAWFMSSYGMNNSYAFWDNASGSKITQKSIFDQTGTAQSFTANGQDYTVTYDATANSIKFQSSPDYYEQYTLTNGVVMRSSTDFNTESWSSSPVFSYEFTPDSSPVITIDVVAQTATVSNIEAGMDWQYQVNGFSWVNGTKGTGATIDISAYRSAGYVNIAVQQADATGNYYGSQSEHAYQSASFSSTPTTTGVYNDVLYSTPASGLFDLTSGGSDRVVLNATAATNGNDQIKVFTFGDTNGTTYGLGEGDMIDLTAFLGNTYGVADADTTTSGIQAFAGSSMASVDIDNQIDNKVALVSGITDAIATGNGLSDDIAALFGSGKTFAGLAEGHKAAVLVQGADSTSATLWYATGNANGTATAQQVANMTNNIGSLNAITQENFYNPIL